MKASNRQLTAVSFILLLAGHEAVRTSNLAEEARASRGAETNLEATQSSGGADLDWKGCGAKSLTCTTEGCAREYVWLDTVRQSCRFTEEYKLQNQQVEFLEEELSRLEEKSEKFANNGCILGGLWGKCTRRMKQMLRLLRYVKKAMGQAQIDPSHPAHEVSISEETQLRVEGIANNLAKGFASNPMMRRFGLDYQKAFEELVEVPTKAADATEALIHEEKGHGCGDDDACHDDDDAVAEEIQSSQEQGTVLEAMLGMVGVTMTEDQKATVMMNLHLSREEDGRTDEEIEDEIINAIDNDIGDTMIEHVAETGLPDSGLDISRRAYVQAQVAGSEEMDDETSVREDDLEEAEMQIEDIPGGSLLQVQQNMSNQVSVQGRGPLKILFSHGPGWLLSRIAWLFLFLIGSVTGVIRAGVFFPLLFVGCLLAKFIKWIFVDILYNYGWEGEGQKVVKGFMSLGRCAPDMWDLVGFDPTLMGRDALGQIVMQPARFASWATNVYHPFKAMRDLCKGVVCGQNAVCVRGQCRCASGFYPLTDDVHGCGLITTRAGCVCLPHWSSREKGLFMFTQTFVGCPNWGWCKVDRNHPTYRSCKANIPTKGWLLSIARSKDHCRPQALHSVRQKVPVAVPVAKPKK